jgi:hypothetical protein
MLPILIVEQFVNLYALLEGKGMAISLVALSHPEMIIILIF